MTAELLTLPVPTHATHVVCNALGDVVAWATSLGVALAVSERHGPGAYVATHVAESPEEGPMTEADIRAILAELDEVGAWLDTFAPPSPDCAGCELCDPVEREHTDALLRELAAEEAAEEARPRCEHGFARARDGKCRRCDIAALDAAEEAIDRQLAIARERRRVTQAVAEEAPAKLTVGFTEGGNLATRSRKVLRRAGVAIPERISPLTVGEAVLAGGFLPVIVPAREL